MKKKITALGYTLLFFVEQLILPKITPLYLEWIEYDPAKEFPAGLIFLLGILWFAQLALAIYLWFRVFDPGQDN